MVDDDLDLLFSQARETRHAMPSYLAARMVQDATAIQAELNHAPKSAQAHHHSGFWAQVQQTLGGWAGLSGLATACAAGVWIGLAPPDFLPDPVELVLQQQMETDLFQETGLGTFLTEEG
jgi:hypothetical protein